MIAADGMAALIGKRYGNIKIYKEKTLEGTLSFIFTVFLWIEASNYLGEIYAPSISILPCGCNL
jgi:dolichol kinase